MMFLKTCLKLVLLSVLINLSLSDDYGQCAETNQTKNQSSSIIIFGLFSSLVFCFVGILPSFFIRSDADEEKFVNSKLFKLLLAFAAGSLLGDVFLHLLPEAYSRINETQAIKNGLFTILSFLAFLVIEKVTEMIPNAHALGTLNLVANFLDNSAHGTTVVGAFQNSMKFGIVALIATVIHEVPHEFSDFALLLKDGYTRKKAVYAQLTTAFAGTIGATISYYLSIQNQCNNLENNYLKELKDEHHLHDHHGHGSLLLPFTIGGFLYIALVGIIPDIIKETNFKTSVLQIISFITGVLFILCLTQFETILANYFL